MIPVAAFAVTATGVSAFNGDILEKIDVDLTTSQIEALEESHELRKAGDYNAAREVLEDADIDREIMHEVRSALQEHRTQMRDAIKAAIEDGDYEEFQNVIADSPLAEHITSESDFEQFIEAHELMAEGEFESAREILDELGIERKGRHDGHGKHLRGYKQMKSE